MNILVIDGQGGRIGREVIERIKAEGIDGVVTAIGTNSIATAAMLKGGADLAATGENAVRVNARSADVIIGPIAIVVADAARRDNARYGCCCRSEPCKKAADPDRALQQYRHRCCGLLH